MEKSYNHPLLHYYINAIRKSVKTTKIDPFVPPNNSQLTFTIVCITIYQLRTAGSVKKHVKSIN